ncbi:MAG TPA: hypothetical protein VK814_07595 [Acidobacteriaceae bacterium]|nr:hypothetical protein [Acidobacteriaceae bacterium]
MPKSQVFVCLTSEVRLVVNKATNQNGGNCIETAAGDQYILLDGGRPQDALNDVTGLLQPSLQVAK